MATPGPITSFEDFFRRIEALEDNEEVPSTNRETYAETTQAVIEFLGPPQIPRDRVFVASNWTLHDVYDRSSPNVRRLAHVHECTEDTCIVCHDACTTALACCGKNCHLACIQAWVNAGAAHACPLRCGGNPCNNDTIAEKTAQMDDDCMMCNRYKRGEIRIDWVFGPSYHCTFCAEKRRKLDNEQGVRPVRVFDMDPNAVFTSVTMDQALAQSEHFSE